MGGGGGGGGGGVSMQFYTNMEQSHVFFSMCK